MPIDPATWELGKDPAFTELTKSINGLITIVKQQGSTLGAQQVALQNISVKAKQKDDDETENETEEETDINELKPEAFFKFTMKEVGKILDTKFSEFGKKVDSVSKEFRFGRLSDEAKELKSDYKDFNDWTEEMEELAKQHSTLTLKQLYKMARSENEAKSKELDAKYKEPEAKVEKLRLFGGFKPSSKDVKMEEKNEDGTPKKLTQNEALETAWAEAIAVAPELSQMEDVGD